MRMAGIVATTLRRRTFNKKQQVDARYQFTDPSHLVSPGSHPPSRSPSFTRHGAHAAHKEGESPGLKSK